MDEANEYDKHHRQNRGLGDAEEYPSDLPSAPPLPPAHPGINEDNSNWQGEVLTMAPVHHLGYLLDRFDFAALQTTGGTMQRSMRNVIRARNEKLAVAQRMANLEGPFCVCVVHKELLRREGCQHEDIIGTGGSVYAREPPNTVMSLDLVTKQYTTLAPMITARNQHATAVLGRKLFVMGGWNMTRNRMSDVECLDMKTGQWSALAPMSMSRCHFAAAALGGKIFVTGGYGTEDSAECFDPATGAWAALTPMNTSRDTHAMVSANGTLYVAGGTGHNLPSLKSVECFDPTTSVWTTIAPLNEARRSLGLTVLGDKLYAIGGNGVSGSFSSVECLDLSIPNGQWTPVASMTMPRYGFGAVVAGGKMYAIGGEGTEDSMECFDPNWESQGQWSVIDFGRTFAPDAEFAAV